MTFDLAIIGGGPAGAAAAITAARSGMRVLLLERGRFPRHKVCGEFISPEGLALLESLGLEDLVAGAPRVASARIFAASSAAQFPLSPAAAAISRYELDNALWWRALTAGADCHQQVEARAVSGRGPFEINTSTGVFAARSILNASGRWSNMRRSALHRRPSERWVGWKAHFREREPAASVDLYFFAGGYCGVQTLLDGRVNACAMVHAECANSIEQVLRLNPVLAERSREWQQLSETVATSPLIFAAPETEEGGVLFAGDAAGFIDPFIGDGISLALRGGMMAAQALTECWRNGKPVSEASAAYRNQYQRELRPLFRNSGWLRRLTSIPPPLQQPVMAALRSPCITRFLLAKTRLHGFDHPMTRSTDVPVI